MPVLVTQSSFGTRERVPHRGRVQPLPSVNGPPAPACDPAEGSAARGCPLGGGGVGWGGVGQQERGPVQTPLQAGLPAPSSLGAASCWPPGQTSVRGQHTPLPGLPAGSKCRSRNHHGGASFAGSSSALPNFLACGSQVTLDPVIPVKGGIEAVSGAWDGEGMGTAPGRFGPPARAVWAPGRPRPGSGSGFLFLCPPRTSSRVLESEERNHLTQADFSSATCQDSGHVGDCLLHPRRQW